MPLKKSIVVGCDNASYLAMVLNGIRETESFSYNIISATSSNDLCGIVKALQTDLVILSFRNNQHVLNHFHSSQKKQVPVLCLTQPAEYEKLRWADQHIVFTCPLELARHGEHFSPRLQSIFLLGAAQEQPAVPATLAGQALRARYEQTSDLSRYVLELDQKTEVLSKVRERIVELYPEVDDATRSKLISIVNSIKVAANDNKLWDDFKLYFERTNPNFLLALAQKYPELTSKDLKYCCYLKMNMSNDDIRHLLGINQESVRTHKYRLKKKMNLSKDQDLIHFLHCVDLAEAS